MTLNDPARVTPESQQPQPASASRARRRRHGQIIVPQDAEGRAALLPALARRAYPSYELFVFALLCGAILGLGYFLDSEAVLVFGILLAPLLTPWVGLLLSSLTGSARFFFDTLAALLISAALIFLSGLLAGLAVRVFLPRTLNEAFLHTRLWWPDLIVLAIGAVILTLSFIRSEERPYLPSLMLSYEFFLPLSAGGFGLGSGVADLWPHGVLVFFVHFAWAGVFGIATLIALRFVPTNLNGFALSGGTSVVMIATLVLLMSGGNWTAPTVPLAAAPTSTPALTVTSPALPTIFVSSGESPTPLIETSTPGEEMTSTPEATSTPGATPSATLTIEPTPVYARISTDQGGGANLRKAPNGKFIVTLDDGSIVEVQPDTQDVNGVIWAHVIAIRNNARLDGWILQSVLIIDTPVPIWNPSSTPAATATP
jgi:hypothetical protein